MKNQKWGSASGCIDNINAVVMLLFWSRRLDCLARDAYLNLIDTDAQMDYEKKRGNGRGRGRPPFDGAVRVTKGHVEGGMVYGVKGNDGNCHIVVCYDEGPGDKTWMEERDWEYIQQLVRDGRLLELEPNADKEIAADHHYRAEIAGALKAARAAARSMAVGNAVDTTQNCFNEATARFEDLKQIMDATARGLYDALQSTHEVKTPDEILAESIREINKVEAERKKQFELARKALAGISTQAEIALKASQTLEKRKMAGLELKVVELAANADEAVEEAKKANETFTATCTACERSCLAITETKEGIIKLVEYLLKQEPPADRGSGKKQKFAEVERLDDEMRDLDLQLIPYSSITCGKRLGEGGFGTVYECTWEYGPGAIKKLKSTLSKEGESEFSRETKNWKKFAHVNVVQLYGISVDESAHYCMVMELMPEGSLYGVLHNGSPLNWKIRFNIANDVAAGLTHLHNQNIVHRDLKSQNVLLGAGMRAKLSDFGLSKVRVEMQTTSGSRAGTVRWMSPESCQGKGSDEESDVYSFGMLLWELASRKIPYEEILDDLIVMGLIVARKKEKIPEECPEQYRGECSEKSRRDYLSYAGLIARCWKERAERPTIQEAVRILEPLKEAARTVLPGRPFGTADGTPTPPRPLGKRAGGSGSAEERRSSAAGPSREAAAAPPPSGPVFKLGTGR